MSFFDFVLDETSWQAFLDKENAREFSDSRLIKKLESVISKKKYLKFDKDFLYNIGIPAKVILTSHNTSKTRTVYVYPEPYRTILKLMVFYIQLMYVIKFSSNSLAYTIGRSVKTAFSLINKYKIKKSDIVYKSDFSDYFNSINIDLLEDKLYKFFDEDVDMTEYIMTLLRNPKVLYRGNTIIEENKGVMAGSPIAGILANIFMDDVDKAMLDKNYRYIRYADDTLIVGREAYQFFEEKIKELGITINPNKTEIMNISTGITFLGFIHVNKIIDISEKAKDKMKSRFKRRAKWYRQWMLRKNVKKEVAIRDYIKKLNFKLYSDSEDSVNWSRWYLPNINTKRSLKYLDGYFVDCIRYIDSGTWTKGKKFYRLSYADIKNLGYRSLVNEYYKIRKANRNGINS